jgi:hypothetical protein
MDIHESVITVPWYREGPGEQEPLLLEFRCSVRPMSNGKRFTVDAVESTGPDPFIIPGFSHYKTRLRFAVRAKIAELYDVEVEQIVNIQHGVMWYNTSGQPDEGDDE